MLIQQIRDKNYNLSHSDRLEIADQIVSLVRLARDERAEAAKEILRLEDAIVELSMQTMRLMKERDDLMINQYKPFIGGGGLSHCGCYWQDTPQGRLIYRCETHKNDNQLPTTKAD
jgi:hypothetical protein